MMHNPEFGATRRLERAYASALRTIAEWVLRARDMEDLRRRAAGPEVRHASELLARRMVGWASVANARTWREAARRSQRGTWLYEQMRHEMRGALGARVEALVQENARYISSVVPRVADELTREIAAAQRRGARPGTVEKMARQRFPEILRSRVRLIARTETSKASAALTRARADGLGLRWYLWQTSEDARVRSSHRKMDQVLVPYAHPPSPEALAGLKSGLGRYHSGESPNCRCTQIVLLSADDVKFPRRVYWSGVIRVMNKQEFLRIA